MTELEFLYAELAAVKERREHTNQAENALGRVLRRDDQQIERIEARIAELEAGEAPTPTPSPTPTPTPTPTPVPAPTDPASLGHITTLSGDFEVIDLGAISEGKAYRLDRDILLTRDPHSDAVIDEKVHVFEGIRFTLLPGSIRSSGVHLDGCEPTTERMMRAIDAGRIMPYSMAAFDGWPKVPEIKAEPEVAYRPDRIYGRSGMNNDIAYAITGAGGEYGSSRGFLAADDCHMVMGAYDDRAEQFATASIDCFSDTLYGLSLPKLAIWSSRNNMLRDPQVPFEGDLGFTNEGSRKDADNYSNEGKITFPDDFDAALLKELGAVAGTAYSHTRDEAHLFNHGYAYWLASGDPRAALLQQAIATYALASVYLGANPDGSHRARFGYQRATMNIWSAAWKLRDTAIYAKGPLLWDADYAHDTAYEVIHDWKRQLAAMDAADDIYSRASSIFRGIDNGVTATDSAYSNFMIQGYGPEAAYLWASIGEPAMLERIAENMVLRFLKIGGTRGVYGKGSGSGFRLLEDGKLPYDDADGLVRWTNDGNSLPNDSFDGSAQHTVQRAYWALRMAEDAARRGWSRAVPDVRLAIEAMEAAREKRAPNNSLSVVSVKHAAIPWTL